jgi:hypothetical protein
LFDFICTEKKRKEEEELMKKITICAILLVFGRSDFLLSRELKIIAGKNPKEFKFLEEAAIYPVYKKGRGHCTSLAISERKLLLAAHCLVGKKDFDELFSHIVLDYGLKKMSSEEDIQKVIEMSLGRYFAATKESLSFGEKHWHFQKLEIPKNYLKGLGARVRHFLETGKILSEKEVKYIDEHDYALLTFDDSLFTEFLSVAALRDLQKKENDQGQKYQFLSLGYGPQDWSKEARDRRLLEELAGKPYEAQLLAAEVYSSWKGYGIELAELQGSGTHFCYGDSGGPLVRRARGKWKVFALIKGGDSSCSGSEKIVSLSKELLTNMEKFFVWTGDPL